MITGNCNSVQHICLKPNVNRNTRSKIKIHEPNTLFCLCRTFHSPHSLSSRETLRMEHHNVTRNAARNFFLKMTLFNRLFHTPGHITPVPENTSIYQTAKRNFLMISFRYTVTEYKAKKLQAV